MTWSITFWRPRVQTPAIVEALSEACGKIINENEDYAKEIWDAYGASPFYKDTDEAIEALKADDELYMAYSDVFQKGL